MKLLITGVSHKTAPVEIRERLAFPESALAGAVSQLRSCPGVSEALILSTCNRVELAVTSEDDVNLRSVVCDFLAGARQVPLDDCLYHHEGREAIQHVFRVAASLDSMILGEPQILGQLKTAYQIAKDQGTVSGLLDTVLARALNVAKRVRTETGIGQMAVSVSYAAVELARKIFGDLDGRTVMIVGAGKMSELAARHLRRSGASHIFVTNRTYERALEMANLFHGTPVEYTKFLGMLPEVDILITSSGAPHYILHKADVQHVIGVRRNKPMFLIDIAVPRNIAPNVNEVDNVFLYDIDDLQGVVNANLREREKEAAHAERIIAEEVEQTLARLKAREIAPAIVTLRERWEEIRVAEIEKARAKLGALTRQQEEALDNLTRAIVNKIAHAPVSELKKHASQPEGVHVVDAIRKVFHLK